MVYGTAVSLTVCLLALRSLDAGESSWESRRRYCGKDLSTAMSLVCEGWYKRSDPALPPPSDTEVTPDVAEVTELLFPVVVPRRVALAMVRQAKRGGNKIGIVDECCRNSCSISELRNYCGKKDY